MQFFRPVIAAVLAVLAFTAAAQEYPERSVKIVAPTAPAAYQTKAGEEVRHWAEIVRISGAQAD